MPCVRGAQGPVSEKAWRARGREQAAEVCPPCGGSAATPRVLPHGVEDRARSREQEKGRLATLIACYGVLVSDPSNFVDEFRLLRTLPPCCSATSRRYIGYSTWDCWRPTYPIGPPSKWTLDGLSSGQRSERWQYSLRSSQATPARSLRSRP